MMILMRFPTLKTFRCRPPAEGRLAYGFRCPRKAQRSAMGLPDEKRYDHLELKGINQISKAPTHVSSIQSAKPLPASRSLSKEVREESDTWIIRRPYH